MILHDICIYKEKHKFSIYDYLYSNYFFLKRFKWWAIIFRGLLIMEVLFNIVFVIALIATIFCLCVFMGGLFIAFQKNELPDIKDV